MSIRERTLRQQARRVFELAREVAGSGPTHRRKLADIDVRIVVSGVRGKSMTVRRLHDVFHRRGYDTYAKMTGDEALSIHNGEEQEIDRTEQVRLYENERELRRVGSVDVAIIENQGIREYTTRLVNEQFVRPHVVFLTNIRQDHQSTLGKDRLTIARSLARSIPEGTPVVCGEQDTALCDYLEHELARRDAPLTRFTLPPDGQSIPGAECVYGLSYVLEAVGEPPLSETAMRRYLSELEITWQRVPNGLVYNAAAVNDVQSTETVRQALIDDASTVVQPLLYLRDDRRGRTSSFRNYLEVLAERESILQARVVGTDASLFARRASFPVLPHDETSERPSDVLDAALADGWPLLLMGNTVSEFMRELLTVIDHRAVATDADEPDPRIDRLVDKDGRGSDIVEDRSEPHGSP